MALVRRTGTKPEIAAARILRDQGVHFQRNVTSLSGTPDLTIPKDRIAIFVHGCFWHRHGCNRSTTPRSNREYWISKFEDNVRRDRRVARRIRMAGWRCFVVWECEIPRGVARALAGMRLRNISRSGRRSPADHTRWSRFVRPHD
jgi:DNA mismatch endonuclease, patch repair protein